jgi:hypothetical protein
MSISWAGPPMIVPYVTFWALLWMTSISRPLFFSLKIIQLHMVG